MIKSGYQVHFELKMVHDAVNVDRLEWIGEQVQEIQKRVAEDFAGALRRITVQGGRIEL
jgi:uncharacterized protein with HEPN domain